MRNWTIILPVILAMAMTIRLAGQQEPPKVSFTGHARSQFYSDRFKNHFEEDTTTTVLSHSGNVLADLGAHIRPSKNTEIQAVIRVRNDYGGFWGSGVSFDVRQLYIKGVAADIFKYQLGDINYKMTPYTLYNNNQEFFAIMPDVLKRQMDVVNYDKFYNNDNSWRQQGAAAECAIAFPSFIQQINLKGVATRIKTSDFGQTNDRIFSGATMEILQSKRIALGIHHSEIFDIKGTSRNNTFLSLPVSTITTDIKNDVSEWNLALHGEAGKSSRKYIHAPEFRVRNGQFMDLSLKILHKSSGLSISGKWHYVTPDFRSPGAQTKRIQYNGQLAGLSRIGNDQHVRDISMMDLTRESDLCTTQLQTSLMPVAKPFDFITPYGDATPNRAGYHATAQYSDTKGRGKMEITYYDGSEIRGEGTTQLRQFNRLQATFNLNIATLVQQNDRIISLTIMARQDDCKRPSPETVRNVSLKNQSISAGAEIEVVKNWSITAGWITSNTKGFDFLSISDNQENIIAFEEESFDLTQEMWASGIKYNFSKKAFLTINYQKFYYNNKLTINNSYTISQWMLLYQLEF